MTGARVQNRLVILLTAALAVFCYGLIWICFKPIVFSGQKSDFACFYRAGRMVVAGEGSQVYDLEAERRYDQQLSTSFVDVHGHWFSLPFVFPPYSLALFAVLSCLPYRLAEFVWYLANVGMLLALPFALPRTLGWKNKAIAAQLLAPVFFIPGLLALMQGQPSILLLLLFAVAFADLSADKEIGAGITLAFATLKPQLALPMLLALVVWRKWRTLAAFAWTGVALLGVSTAIVGWPATLHYPQAVMEFNQLAGALGGEHPDSMPNLRGCLYVFLQGHLSPAALASITIALSILMLIGLAMLLKRASAISDTSLSLVVVASLLVGYHAYLHDDSLLLLPILLTVSHLGRSRWTITRGALAAAIAALYVIPLLPTSLRTTAMQMFAVMTMLAAVLAVEITNTADRESTEETERQPCNTPAFSRR